MDGGCHKGLEEAWTGAGCPRKSTGKMIYLEMQQPSRTTGSQSAFKTRLYGIVFILPKSHEQFLQRA